MYRLLFTFIWSCTLRNRFWFPSFTRKSGKLVSICRRLFQSFGQFFVLAALRAADRVFFLYWRGRKCRNRIGLALYYHMGSPVGYEYEIDWTESDIYLTFPSLPVPPPPPSVSLLPFPRRHIDCFLSFRHRRRYRSDFVVVPSSGKVDRGIIERGVRELWQWDPFAMVLG